MTTETARVVSNFTPFLYIRTYQSGDQYVVSMSDLCFDYHSMLPARIILDHDKKVIGESAKAFDRLNIKSLEKS